MTLVRRSRYAGSRKARRADRRLAEMIRHNPATLLLLQGVSSFVQACSATQKGRPDSETQVSRPAKEGT